MKKRIFSAIAAMVCFAFASQAQLSELNIFNHLAVSANVGTNGIGFEGATTVTDWVSLRAGVSFMPNITFKTDVDIDATEVLTSATGVPVTRSYTENVEVGMGRTQGHLIFNFYPMQRRVPLYLAVGAYFGGAKMLKIKGHSDKIEADLKSGIIKNPDMLIGEYQIPMNPENGDIEAGLKVGGFRPYLGIGWGQAVPSRRVNFGIELGVQFHGKMKPYTEYGEISEDLLDEADDDLKKVMDKLTVWPVLKFTLSGRIF